VSFRVTAAQRAELEALAAAKGVTVNELARARTVAGLEPNHRVTPSRGNGGPPRDLTVEYDEVHR
jgi:hypothetical protein